MSVNKKQNAVTDTKQVRILKEAGTASSTKANRESKALGLTVRYIENGELIDLMPDGQKNVVDIIEKEHQNNPVLKKGKTLWRK